MRQSASYLHVVLPNTRPSRHKCCTDLLLALIVCRCATSKQPSAVASQGALASSQTVWLRHTRLNLICDSVLLHVLVFEAAAYGLLCRQVLHAKTADVRYACQRVWMHIISERVTNWFAQCAGRLRRPPLRTRCPSCGRWRQSCPRGLTGESAAPATAAAAFLGCKVTVVQLPPPAAVPSGGAAAAAGSSNPAGYGDAAGHPQQPASDNAAAAAPDALGACTAKRLTMQVRLHSLGLECSNQTKVSSRSIIRAPGFAVLCTLRAAALAMQVSANPPDQSWPKAGPKPAVLLLHAMSRLGHEPGSPLHTFLWCLLSPSTSLSVGFSPSPYAGAAARWPRLSSGGRRHLTPGAAASRGARRSRLQRRPGGRVAACGPRGTPHSGQ